MAYLFAEVKYIPASGGILRLRSFASSDLRPLEGLDTLTIGNGNSEAQFILARVRRVHVPPKCGSIKGAEGVLA